MIHILLEILLGAVCVIAVIFAITLVAMLYTILFVK